MLILVEDCHLYGWRSLYKRSLYTWWAQLWYFRHVVTVWRLAVFFVSRRTRTSLGDRSFTVTGPHLRRNLLVPLHLRDAELALLKFCLLLKMQLFTEDRWPSQWLLFLDRLVHVLTYLLLLLVIHHCRRIVLCIETAIVRVAAVGAADGATHRCSPGWCGWSGAAAAARCCSQRRHNRSQHASTWRRTRGSRQRRQSSHRSWRQHGAH